MRKVKKVVLAYSGGLDTSIIIPWIKENYGGAEIVAYCGDVGQGDDLEAVRRKALATGASECIVEDLREEFVRDYAFKALAAGAVYEDNYLLGTALARPLLAYRPGAGRAGRRRRRAGPRRHRQGQRPGPLRGDLRDLRAAPHGDRAVARVGHPLARGRARLRRGPRRARGPVAARHVQPRRQPLAPVARGREPRGPVGRAAQGDVQAHRRSRGRAGQAGGGDDRLRAGRARVPGRHAARARGPGGDAEPDRGRARRRAGSTWWRTAWWASSRAASTRRRPAPCCTSRTARSSGWCSTATRCTSSSPSPSATRSSSTTGCGSRPCARRWPPSWTRPRRRSRARCACGSSRAGRRPSAAARRAACTARTWPPSARAWPTTTRTRRASSGSSACPSGCAP